MLKKFDRDDLEKIWDLVKERFNTKELTNDKEKELWVELKRLFKPDNNDMLWKLQRGYDIFMLVKNDYLLTRALMTIMWLQVDESSEMANELLRKIFYQANKPRS
ncbi:hypothetical protein Tco_0768662, partial [Tanacetum coccineum]